MKIVKVDYESIVFDNGSKITFEHDQDCCEWNYADFKQIEDEALEFNFNENLDFEKVEGSGFTFGNEGVRMFFIPCYSEQNGYYSSDIDIFFNDKKVFNLLAKECIY